MAASLSSPASSPNSPPSTDGPQSPSPNSVQTLALPPPVDASPQVAPTGPPATQPKRKPSRRANTAERRATHNAVERARRETLNGRFLVCHFNFHLFCPPNILCSQSPSLSTLTSYLIGLGRPPSQPLPNSSSFQVFHRQLFHRPYSRFPQAPSSCCTRTPSS